MVVDTAEDETLKDEGFAREIINRVQKLRKSVSYGSNRNERVRATEENDGLSKR